MGTLQQSLTIVSKLREYASKYWDVPESEEIFDGHADTDIVRGSIWIHHEADIISISEADEDGSIGDGLQLQIDGSEGTFVADLGVYHANDIDIHDLTKFFEDASERGFELC